MIGRVAAPLVLASVLLAGSGASYGGQVHTNGLTICSVIINEMSNGQIGLDEGREISEAIANAANRHFGRVTCGEMWLYMAIAYVESGFRNNVVNYLNCRGMFQVHAPSWARKFGLTYKDLLVPDMNADAGIRVFKYYLERYKRVVPALSAYNSDHPEAATGYARSVLVTRLKIKRRYTELYRSFRKAETLNLAQLPH